MKAANFAPVYCALYPELATIARDHGYALAVHGSLARDGDLICIPWVEEPAHPQMVVDAICGRFAVRQIGDFEPKAHGRVAVSISVAHGECAFDLAFMPITGAKGAVTPMSMEERVRAVGKRAMDSPGKPVSVPADVVRWIDSLAPDESGALLPLPRHVGHMNQYVISERKSPGSTDTPDQP